MRTVLTTAVMLLGLSFTIGCGTDNAEQGNYYVNSIPGVEESQESVASSTAESDDTDEVGVDPSTEAPCIRDWRIVQCRPFEFRCTGTYTCCYNKCVNKCREVCGSIGCADKCSTLH